MNKDAVRDAIAHEIAHEIAPLLLRCAAIDAEISREEASLPILLYEHPEYDAIQARRKKLAKIIGELNMDRVVQSILRHVEGR
jgi:hypothetical protein